MFWLDWCNGMMVVGSTRSPLYTWLLVTTRLMLLSCCCLRKQQSMRKTMWEFANGAASLILWVGQYGKTALHWAARHNSLEVAKLLLGAGAAADVKDKVRTRFTGLCNRTVAVTGPSCEPKYWPWKGWSWDDSPTICRRTQSLWYGGTSCFEITSYILRSQYEEYVVYEYI